MKRRAIILPVVLVVIGLLALTIAGFVFFVRAESTGVFVAGESVQARLAAEGGLENFLAVIRKDRHNFAAYYDNPAQLRNVLVWSERFDRQGDPVRELGSRKEYLDRNPAPAAAWRVSIVAPRLDGPAGAIRFGGTPESARLNINSASDLQIESLVGPILRDLGYENAQEVINAILDWRDTDSQAREGGAENEYYNTLTPAYNTKNAPLDTVEELLLVKGVTVAVLYGEDSNRNGVLDANEDDGEATDPTYDNGDGVLNLGIAPFLTVFAREVDTALDNKPRINLNQNAAIIAAQVAEQVADGQLSPETIAFVSNLQGAQVSAGVLRSPADLLAPGPNESIEDFASTPAAASQPSGASGQTQPRETQSDGQADRSGDDRQGRAGNPGDDSNPPADRKDDRDQKSREVSGDSGKSDSRMQKADPQETPDRGDSITPKAPTDSTGGKGPQQIGGGGRGPRGGGGAGQGAGPVAPGTGGGRPGRGGRGPGGRGGQSPQQQLEATYNALKSSPVKLEELPVLMDRFSTVRSQQTGGVLFGLTNINAAPLRVLQLVPGMTPEAAASIVAARQGMDPALMTTTAWPLVAGVVDAKTFKKIAPYVTTKAYQYHVEAVGYADHTKVARRVEWVIEMIGPMAQVKYQRDLTSLGMAWPVDSETVIVSNK